MNWKNIANAILLETMFAAWSGRMYDLFALGGVLNGMGEPREVFLAVAVPITPPDNTIIN